VGGDVTAALASADDVLHERSRSPRRSFTALTDKLEQVYAGVPAETAPKAGKEF
jgi:hypothetical protein